MSTTANHRPLAIIHANCQGEPLAEFLGRVPGLAHMEVRLYTNYVREHVPDEALARCELFLYQPLSPGWGPLASRELLAKLPSSAVSLAFPSMFLQAYWPFWGSGDADGLPGDYPDSLLDRLLSEGLAPAEAVRVYCRTKVVLAHDLEGTWEQSLARERAKEEKTPIKHVDVMLARYQKEMLFNLVNHPGHGMLCWLGRRILEELDLDGPAEGVEAAMPELYPEFRLPVHPLVAERMGLEFAGPDTRYPVYGRELTFEEYALEYAVARADKVESFIGFLRMQGER